MPAALAVPCWGCPKEDDGAVRFRTDLDLLAPLGDGGANAALWLKDFTHESGSRLAEAQDAEKARVDGPAWIGKVLPAESPLLREAEPWADQATMRFYPDVFPIEGVATRIPNLLVALTLSKSWVARAEANPDAPGALDDCRRAIRWGRLLRQEDTTLIQDLVGLASIRIGAQGLYDIAARRGDQPLMLASAIVLGEHAPQRLRTAAIVTKVNVRTRQQGAWSLSLSDRKLEEVIGVANDGPDRRFRMEAIVQMAIVRSLGSRSQRAAVEKALDALGAAKDPLVVSMARWARQAELTGEEMGEPLDG